MRIFSYEELDELGEGMIRQYLGKEAERTCCVDIEGFVTDFLKLPLLYRNFAEEDSDKIGFIADGVTPLRVCENGTVAVSYTHLQFKLRRTLFPMALFSFPCEKLLI